MGSATALLLLGPGLLQCGVSPDTAPLATLADQTAVERIARSLVGASPEAQELCLSSDACPWSPPERHCWPWPADWLLGLTSDLPHCYGCVCSHGVASEPGDRRWTCPASRFLALWDRGIARESTALPVLPSPSTPGSPALAAPRYRRS